MNPIEKAIAVFSPKTAYQRARYRMAATHFDAAGKTYRQKGWKAPGGDANRTNSGAVHLIRNRSRDMVRNNPIAARAVSALEKNIVGDGIIPSAETRDAGLRRDIEALLIEHCDTTKIDAHGVSNLYGMQSLALRSIIEGGEILWLKRQRRPSDGVPLNFQVEALEPEFLDGRRYGLLANGNSEYDGIELDLIGRRVAYRLFEAHPEGMLNGFPTSRRVRADRVIHGYRVERVGQRRGVPWMAPAMAMMHDGIDYADAQLLRQKLSNMFVGFTRDVTGEGIDINAPGGTKADTIDDLVPGMFEHLPPGRDVFFNDPPKVEGYGEHMSQVLHMIAASLDLTFEALTMQLKEVNFSSARMGRIEMNRAMSSHQWKMLIPMICWPLGEWLREGIDMQIGAGRDYSIKWTPPRFEMVDPAREVPPMLKSIEGGLTSRQRVIRSMGHDPEEIDRERREDAEREAEMSLNEDTTEGGNEGAP